MTAADPPPPLSAEQQAEANKVYRRLLELRVSGVRLALVTLDGGKIGVRATGDREDIALLKYGLTISPTV